MKRARLFLLWILCLAIILPAVLAGQVTKADYDRALGLREKLQGLVYDVPERPVWIDNTHRFWYRKSVKDGFEFIIADAAAAAKGPAFDHARLAAALAAASGEKVDPKSLPFNSIAFADDEKTLTFTAFNARWKCDLGDYTCARLGPIELQRAYRWVGLGQGGPPAQSASSEAKARPTGSGKRSSATIMSGSGRKTRKKNFL